LRLGKGGAEPPELEKRARCGSETGQQTGIRFPKDGWVARELSDSGFDVVSVYFDGSVLIDQFDGKNKAQSAVFSDQSALNALHDAAFDADFFADNQVAIGLGALPAEAGAEKLNFGVGNGERFALRADDLDDAGALKDFATLGAANAHKKVGWKKGQRDRHLLAVFPDANGFIGGKKGFNAAQIELPGHRLLILRESEGGIPFAVIFPQGGGVGFLIEAIMRAFQNQFAHLKVPL
jgi:hypothetical protein